MADINIFYYAAPNLLCTEGTRTLSFDEDDLVNGKLYETNNDDGLRTSNGRSILEPLIDFPCLSEDNFSLMLEREKEFLPKDDYLRRLRNGDLDLNGRREALDWISKAHAYYSFGALSLCLSVNYLDRFLSVYDLPQDKPWVVQLLAVSCLSLAAKLEETEVPFIVDLQHVGEPKFLFGSKAIQKMELFILSTLKWKMRSCTPFTFIDYFLKKINENELLPSDLIARSVPVILSTIKGIDFLEFRPSEIAVSAAVSVSSRAMDINEALSGFIGIDKERVIKCLELVQDLTRTSMIGPNGMPQSPDGVLEAACLGSKIDERTYESCLTSSPSSPRTKRRKIEPTSAMTGDDLKP